MEQPWKQRQGEGGGFGFAMGESSCHADLDEAMTTDRPCEVDDGALLMMELMEDLPSSDDDLLLDGDADRQLSHVIRSLEAEIGGESAEAVAMVADDGGGEGLDRIEDVLSEDMDGYDDYEGDASRFGYWPHQVSPSLNAGHDEAEGWCVYTNNTSNGYEGGSVLGYDDTVDHHYYYCCAEGSADHMYLLPLWE